MPLLCLKARTPFVLFAIPLITGCATADFTPTSDDDAVGAGSDDTAVEAAPPPFEPTAGIWTVTSSTLEQDGCGLEDAVDRGEPGSEADLASLGNSNFQMTFASGGETVACAVEDEDSLVFSCDATESIDSTATDMGLDADIPFTLWTTGAFSDEWNLEMTSTVEIDCDGADCGIVELLLGTSFPCEMVLSSVMNSSAE